jgi:type II secretory pathway component PulF
MAFLCQELLVINESGIPLLRGLDAIAAHAPGRVMRRVLQSVKANIERGASLGDALHWEGRRFPRLFVKVINSAELSGTLSTALRHLTEYYEDRARLQSQVVTAVTYPALIIVCALLLIPYIKAYVLAGAEVANAFALRALLRWCLIVGVVALLGRLGVWRAYWGGLGPRIGPFPKVARALALARFFRSLALYLDSGMSAPQSIEHAAAASDSRVIERDVSRAAPRVRQGEPFTDAFRDCRYVTPESLAFVAVGEESGKLEDALARLSGSLLDTAMHRLRTAVLLIEGILILLIGLMYCGGLIGGAIAI